MKTYFSVVPKRKPDPGKLNSSESCPYCRMSFMDFADILGGGVVLGCYNCGGIFMSKECRGHDKALKGEQLRAQSESTGEVGFSESKESTPESPTVTAADAMLVGTTTDETSVDDDVQVSFTAKCGKVMATDKKRKQHEAVCKACKAKRANLLKN